MKSKLPGHTQCIEDLTKVCDSKLNEKTLTVQTLSLFLVKKFEFMKNIKRLKQEDCDSPVLS